MREVLSFGARVVLLVLLVRGHGAEYTAPDTMYDFPCYSFFRSAVDVHRQIRSVYHILLLSNLLLSVAREPE